MANLNIRRRSGFIQRSGVMRRETQWLELGATATVLATVGSASITNALTVAEKALRPFTVVRTRGILHTISDQVVADEVWHLAFGACVVSDQAVAIGATAVPTPDTDRDSDLWFLFEEQVGFFEFATAIGFQERVEENTHRFDSRAMRKVEEGQDLIFVKENGAMGSDGLNCRSAGRVLIKLH